MLVVDEFEDASLPPWCSTVERCAEVCEFALEAFKPFFSPTTSSVGAGKLLGWWSRESHATAKRPEVRARG